ncbi:hypothetical protein [Pseudomonas palleroniana]|uniref:hypothetical protein n=1 Tax=Pseudomonas palleroniana TaxID=191390 RepID=UPI001FD4E8EE|nr:hypothetical protein [Pseudomonas palleroniana]UOP10246.1 hypothetical protein LDL65_24700 [Pseudomonas palleroniana]
MNQSTDPRASMAAYGQAAAPQQFSAAQYARFYETAPSISTDSVSIWYARGQNFVVAHVEARAGGVIERLQQIDEYVVLSLDPTVGFEVEWEGGVHSVPGASIAFVPAGASLVRIKDAGRVTLMFTALNTDVRDLCANSDAYDTPNGNIPPFEPWPNAEGSPRVRSYSLDVADEPGRFGRIWRCSTFMVNVLSPQIGPRDVTKLSPHHHDTFEQGSLALEGAFTHHIRWPWNSDLTTWRSDEHEQCASPSLAVIPPPAIHTSQGMEAGVNQLIDIFSPPRFDFSLKAGWVLNADEYLMPPEK